MEGMTTTVETTEAMTTIAEMDTETDTETETIGASRLALYLGACLPELRDGWLLLAGWCRALPRLSPSSAGSPQLPHPSRRTHAGCGIFADTYSQH